MAEEYGLNKGRRSTETREFNTQLPKNMSVGKTHSAPAKGGTQGRRSKKMRKEKGRGSKGDLPQLEAQGRVHCVSLDQQTPTRYWKGGGNRPYEEDRLPTVGRKMRPTHPNLTRP